MLQSLQGRLPPQSVEQPFMWKTIDPSWENSPVRPPHHHRFCPHLFLVSARHGLHLLPSHPPQRKPLIDDPHGPGHGRAPHLLLSDDAEPGSGHRTNVPKVEEDTSPDVESVFADSVPGGKSLSHGPESKADSG